MDAVGAQLNNSMDAMSNSGVRHSTRYLTHVPCEMITYKDYTTWGG